MKNFLLNLKSQTEESSTSDVWDFFYFIMRFLEKDLEQIIYEASEQRLVKDLRLYGKRFRQLRIGNYGIADLVFVDRIYTEGLEFDEYMEPYDTIEDVSLRITVCELKKDTIDIGAFMQAIKYCKGISSYLKKRKIENYFFEIKLIGRNVELGGSFCYLPDLITDENCRDISSGSIKKLNLYSYSYGYDGIEFYKHDGYKLINEGFWWIT